MTTGTAYCLSCKLAAKEDGGDGKCPRTQSYPSLRVILRHECPLFKRRPQKRPPEPPKPEALF